MFTILTKVKNKNKQRLALGEKIEKSLNFKNLQSQ